MKKKTHKQKQKKDIWKDKTCTNKQKAKETKSKIKPANKSRHKTQEAQQQGVEVFFAFCLGPCLLPSAGFSSSFLHPAGFFPLALSGLFPPHPTRRTEGSQNDTDKTRAGAARAPFGAPFWPFRRPFSASPGMLAAREEAEAPERGLLAEEKTAGVWAAFWFGSPFLGWMLKAERGNQPCSVFRGSFLSEGGLFFDMPLCSNNLRRGPVHMFPTCGRGSGAGNGKAELREFTQPLAPKKKQTEGSHNTPPQIHRLTWLTACLTGLTE